MWYLIVSIPDLCTLTYFNEAITTVDISENVILKAISKLKPSKSQGPDNLHAKMIKEYSHQLLTPLKEIFSKSLAKSKIPDIWKRANVTAIHKSGDKTNPENYRPISLTSVASKLMERLICDKIVDHMTQNKSFQPISAWFHTRQVMNNTITGDPGRNNRCHGSGI